MKSATVLGLMSGTSLDGLDICLSRFEFKNDQYQFEILKAASFPYSDNWRNKLVSAIEMEGKELMTLDIELGVYFGELVLRFLEDSAVKPDYIASHGHTIFHQPDKKLTLQIGSGHALFSKTNIPVICDFRTMDVMLGGQGAPLVPIGDLHLFDQYVACINLGGIANISFQKNNQRIAHDICPVNMALSDLTKEIGLLYDDKGNLARKGEINDSLLSSLDALDFYDRPGPKSLGVEWYEANIQPILKRSDLPVNHKLRTMVEHISNQISDTLNTISEGQVLLTGGGAYNDFLVKNIRSKTKHQVIVPDSLILEFKEALIFGFLGWLKINNQINVLRSVTGAERDSSSGILILT